MPRYRDLDRAGRSGDPDHEAVPGADVVDPDVGGTVADPTAGARTLALADRACLATAHVRGLPVVTADRAWAALDLDVEVRVIR